MSILTLLEGIPINVNLRSKIADLEAEVLDLRKKDLVSTKKIETLTLQLEQANIEIAGFKKIPKPPNKLIYNPGYIPDRNM